MPIRIESPIEGLEHCFVEVVDGWTRKEIIDIAAPVEDLQALRPVWEKKVSAVHLQTVDGQALTTVAQVFDQLEELDFRLIGMIKVGLMQATDYLLDLGKAKKRLSFVGADGVARTVQTPKMIPAPMPMINALD